VVKTMHRLGTELGQHAPGRWAARGDDGQWALLPLRMRRIEQVGLHADLTILARLTCALDAAPAVHLPNNGQRLYR
jgi:hypothetical protein